jgi:putative ABC transport system ATP-binding protein
VDATLTATAVGEGRAQPGSPGIQLRSVTKTYKTGDEVLKVLNDVNITIESGDFVAVVGPSGSGKSTLADVIGGLDGIDSGTVTVDGVELTKARDKALSRYRNERIGFVFQNFNLQARYTALENVMLPLVLRGTPSRQRRERAEECLKLVGLADRMRHKPSQLSGGQLQRVAIARALATKPSIIIADEPTGNLDSARGAEIMGVLSDLNRSQGITLIVVTHDMEVARQATTVLSIQDGVVRQSQQVTHAIS